MFWKFTNTCTINSTLDKPDVTLAEVLNDDDILQECKGQNPKLIDYICKPEIMDQLITLTISEPEEDDSSEPIKYKHSNTACELLTSDVAQINNALDSEPLREKLFKFLENPSPINSLLASFFSKVVGLMLGRKPEQTFEHIKKKEDYLGLILKHLGTSAVMDMLLRLVTCIEAPSLKARVLTWLCENKLVERLINHINPQHDEELHTNAAQSLCDVIRLSREHMFTCQESAQEDPIMKVLEKQETIELLLKNMFEFGINESVTINGISVLLALLEIRRPAPFGFPDIIPELTPLDVERLKHSVTRTLKGMESRMPDFVKLLSDPPRKDSMACTFGMLEPPLGNTRLHIVKLISAMLLINDASTNKLLSELHVFNIIFDLFFRYEYNNFLHTQVVNCLHTVLSNTASLTNFDGTAMTSQSEGKECEEKEDDMRKNAPLLTHVFEDCRLIQRILDAWADNTTHETEGKGQRKGYMGHLTIICNHIIQICDQKQGQDNHDRVNLFIRGMAEDEQNRWSDFVGESLAEINEKNSSNLGGHNPKILSDTENDDYTRYDSAQQFGFSDSDYQEADEHDKFSKINQVNFDIKTDTDVESRIQFEKYCTSQIPNIDDSDSMFENVDDDEDWPNNSGEENTGIFGDSNAENSRKSTDEAQPTGEETFEVDKMEVATANDSSDNTTSAGDNTTDAANNSTEEKPEHQTTPHPTETPWFDNDKKTEEKPSDEGWANFDDMSSDKPTETTEEKLPERAQNYSVEKDEPMKDEQTKEEPMKTEETKTEEMKTEEAVVEKSDEMKQDNESSSMEVQPMQVTTTDKTDNDVITSAKSSSVDADDVTMQTDDVGVTSEEKGDSNAASKMEVDSQEEQAESVVSKPTMEVESPQTEAPQPSSAISQEGVTQKQEGNTQKQESGASGDNKVQELPMATEQPAKK